MDRLLLGLAATPGAEVRLFNPFVTGRGSPIGRLWGLATDFGRLNHRMHNKLIVVDGVMAVAGGRNLTDEYFLRGSEGNFIDFDVLLAGPVVAQLGAWFDRYWNARDVIPIATVAATSEGTDALRQAFDAATAATVAYAAPDGVDEYGQRAVGAELDASRLGLLPARAGAHADVPEKRHDSERIRALDGAEARAETPSDSISERFYALLAGAQREVELSSPYFIPGRVGLAALRRLRERGVAVTVLTNATGSSDEPLVNVAYARYRNELLKMGVRLYELASTRLHENTRLQRLFGDSVGRLHAKLALIDRELVLLGSMNLDPRSRHTNTELGLAVRSAELARRIRATYEAGAGHGVYEVVLAADGRAVEWVGRRADGSVERLDSPPGLSWIEKLRLMLMAPLVSEELL
jgi:phosphatidylserine/phosphatidylglycerophosphate/cardiolipin synthase-like enzyme